jgi:hypothetical protein
MRVLFPNDTEYRHCRRHNSNLRKLELSYNPISAPVRKLVKLELVLCQLRNADVISIDARDNKFDDTDVTRIAEALRCEHYPARARAILLKDRVLLCVLLRMAW